MNKKADISITLLVIGVFAVCTLALISFFYSSVQLRNSFFGLDLVEKITADMDKITFSQKDQLKNLPEIKFDSNRNKNYIYEEKITTKGLIYKETIKLFSVSYYLPE